MVVRADTMSLDTNYLVPNKVLSKSILPAELCLSPQAFLDHFSRALRYEYGPQGVFVQSLVPYRVASQEEGDSAGAGWLVPQPQVYARHALSTLGISHRTTGYWPHTIQVSYSGAKPSPDSRFWTEVFLNVLLCLCSLQFRLVQCMPEWIWVLGSRVLCRAT